MSFTLSFLPSLGITEPITVTTSDNIVMTFDTTDNGSTYTLTSSTDTITVLDGFNEKFWSFKLSSVSNTPNTVISIGSNAFNNCISLTSINIPNGVTSIGSGAFQGIQNLASTIVITQITPTPSYAYNWFHNEPDFSSYYNNITFQDNFPHLVCFNKGSKILTINGYIPIQFLRSGDLVKTLTGDYKPIIMIGYCEIQNVVTNERNKDKLYVCTNKEYPEIFEDLVITGCHSILVDEFTSQEQQEKTSELLTKNFLLDTKYRLPACLDDRASAYEIPGNHTVFHLALENDDPEMNHGIYANGLLVETCSKRVLKENTNMKLI